MIASDVGMKVEPDALHAIVVWAIGRQKVEHDAPRPIRGVRARFEHSCG